ncbi:LysM peptidoglycan-binding domain-containing protein [Arthrobacter sp. GMC3]|uniref:LysM peptidoglycan-binding domain-containing protein n=1 Tax=Arthrobacter sp. GMC3 TaxID=2058894 RepID=UPI0011B0A4FB|nr:LysM domain-containing protein [Arthrobacter sp. GMC3]
MIERQVNMMKRQTVADLAMAAAILGLGASLVFAGSSMLQRRLLATRPYGPVGLDEVVGAAAAGIGIAVALWWLLALGCAIASAVAEHRGAWKLASRTAAWSPVFMRRLVATVVGLNLLGAPMALAAAPGSGPDHQSLHAISSSAAATYTAALPVSAWSGSPPRAAGLSSIAPLDDPINPAWTPRSPGVDPGPIVSPQTRPAPEAVQKDGTGSGVVGSWVVVQTGDTLWSIVTTVLGPYATDVEVALAWPQWYRANRDVIGADPNYILPGQVLHAPGS